MDYCLICTKCACVYERDSSIFRCGKCGGILEVSYDYSTLKLPKRFANAKISQKKYVPLFPVSGKLASLGEGGTSLDKAQIKGLDDNGTKLYLKVETGNPTRSFKDRGSSVEITKALEFGYTDIVCASTGNMGLSLATYSKENNMKCTIFMSRNGNREKMERIKRAGGIVIKVDGDFNAATTLAERYAKAKGAFACGDYHYRKEGQKSVAYEIVEQLHYNVPDYIFIQVGNATLIAAMYKALREFRRLKFIRKLPKLVAAQSKECDPLVRAFDSNGKIRHIAPRTIADAIAVGYPTFGNEGLEAVKKTRGAAQSVDDKAIKHYGAVLENELGVLSEPGGAAGFACFMENYACNKKAFEDKEVVVIITGNNEHRKDD